MAFIQLCIHSYVLLRFVTSLSLCFVTYVTENRPLCKTPSSQHCPPLHRPLQVLQGSVTPPPAYKVTATSVANKGEPFISGIHSSKSGVQAFLRTVPPVKHTTAAAAAPPASAKTPNMFKHHTTPLVMVASDPTSPSRSSRSAFTLSPPLPSSLHSPTASSAACSLSDSSTVLSPPTSPAASSHLTSGVTTAPGATQEALLTGHDPDARQTQTGPQAQQRRTTAADSAAGSSADTVAAPAGGSDSSSCGAKVWRVDGYLSPQDMVAQQLPHLTWDDALPPILSFYSFATAEVVTE